MELEPLCNDYISESVTNYFLAHNAKSIGSTAHNRTIIRWVESHLSFWGWLLLSLYLINADARQYVAPVRWSVNLVQHASQQLVSALQLPYTAITTVGHIFTEIKHLTVQNKQLQAINDQLKREIFAHKYLHEENAELRQMLNLASSKAINYQVADVISNINSLLHKQVNINYGTQDGAVEGQVVIGHTSMIGRIYNSTQSSSDILLITDIKSHIPIISEHSRIKGILAGNGSAYPEIINQESMLPDGQFQLGEIIFTSGDDGMLPPAIPIGIVSQLKKQQVLIRLLENPLALEKVMIIKTSVDLQAQ